MSSCLSSHKQKPPEVNRVPSSWVDKLSNQNLFMAKVTCRCLLPLILLVEKIYIIFFLPINATEIQLIWRMSCFQNISTKAVVYLTFQLLCYFKKIFSWKPLFTTNSHFGWKAHALLLLCMCVLSVVFCFLDHNASLHSISELCLRNSM